MTNARRKAIYLRDRRELTQKQKKRIRKHENKLLNPEGSK